MADLDSTDRAILSLLQTDARDLTNTEIGDRIGVSATTVGDRIGKLRERGVIRTCHPDIDYEKAGIPHHLVLFCTVPTREREALALEAVELHGVVNVREFLSGEQNLHVEIVGQSTDEIARTAESLENAGIEICAVEIVKNERRRPFGGIGNLDDVR